MHLFPPAIVDLAAATVDTFALPAMTLHGIKADVLRLDKIHAVVSGNKWFKLKYHLQEALHHRYKSIITAGGAYSNHIVAAAYAARSAGLGSVGIIRGEAPPLLSHTLKEAMDMGMQLTFVSRREYGQLKPDMLPYEQYAAHYYIPEGGAGILGEQGCREILDLVNKHHYTHILCAVGTATMFLGLANSSLAGQQVIGIPVLKGMENLLHQLKDRIDAEKLAHCRIFPEYHWGGYAKKHSALFAFMNGFYRQTAIPTDFVYTGKLAFAVAQLLEKNYFPPGSRLLLIHSGGLQGNLSLPLETLQF